MTRFLLAIDQGTTGSTALVLSERAEVLGRATQRVPAALPAARLGRARRRGDLGERARRGAAARSRSRGVEGRRTSPASASPTSARPRCCGTARRGEPIHRAIVWQDRRTATRCDAAQGRRARAAVPRAHRARARPVLLRAPRSSGCSITCRARARAPSAASSRFGTIDSWLVHRADAAARCTSPTSPTRRARCSSTSERCAWDDELLAHLRVPRARAARGARQRRGRTGARSGVASCPTASRSRASRAISRRRSSARRASPWRREVHLRHGRVPADEHRQRGRALASTACSRPSPGASATRPTYALEGSAFIAGAAVQWLRDRLGIIKNARRGRGARAQGGVDPTASCSCPRSPGSARRTGIRTRAG